MSGSPSNPTYEEWLSKLFQSVFEPFQKGDLKKATTCLKKLLDAFQSNPYSENPLTDMILESSHPTFYQWVAIQSVKLIRRDPSIRKGQGSCSYYKKLMLLACNSRRDDIFKNLYQEGINHAFFTKEVAAETKESPTFFHYCAQKGINHLFYWLAEQGASFVLNNPYGKETTALHYAAQSNDLELFKWILEAHPELNRPDGYNRTPFNYACETGSLLISQWLMAEKGADIEAREINVFPIPQYPHYSPEDTIGLPIPMFDFTATRRRETAPTSTMPSSFLVAFKSGQLETCQWLWSYFSKEAQISIRAEVEKNQYFFDALEQGHFKLCDWALETGLDSTPKDQQFLIKLIETFNSSIRSAETENSKYLLLKNLIQSNTTLKDSLLYPAPRPAPQTPIFPFLLSKNWAHMTFLMKASLEQLDDDAQLKFISKSLEMLKTSNLLNASHTSLAILLTSKLNELSPYSTEEKEEERLKKSMYEILNPCFIDEYMNAEVSTDSVFNPINQEIQKSIQEEKKALRWEPRKPFIAFLVQAAKAASHYPQAGAGGESISTASVEAVEVTGGAGGESKSSTTPFADIKTLLTDPRLMRRSDALCCSIIAGQVTQFLPEI